MLHSQEPDLDPSLNRPKHRQKITVAGAIDRTGAKDDHTQPIPVPENRLLTLPLAQPIVRNRLTGICFQRQPLPSARTDRGLAGEVDKALDIRVPFKTRPDQVLGPHGICSVEDSMIRRLGYSGNLVDLVDPINSSFQRDKIRAIALKNLNRKSSDPLWRVWRTDKTTNFMALIQQSLNEMASNESGSTCDQRPPGCHTTWSR